MFVVRYRSMDGAYRAGRPLRVIEHDDERLVGWLAEGTTVAEPMLADGRGLRDAPLSERWSHPRATRLRPWHGGDLVMVFPRDRAYSLWVFKHGATVRGWYANLEQPYVAGDRVITTEDHVLDLWAPAETGEPQWKDEDELAMAVEVARFTAEEAAAVRAEGERVFAERPWPTPWDAWTPPADWSRPSLPAGWDAE